ncbi:MAG: Rho termination factor N-terminal domain-containing protein [Aggregatilineales bacterium]
MPTTIQLNKHYRDVNGLWLRPGTHTVNDRLAQYLITEHDAIVIESEQDTSGTLDFDDLDKLSKSKLQAYADEQGIASVDKNSMKKDEMIQTILNGGA